jgi:hypothetical protein
MVIEDSRPTSLASEPKERKEEVGRIMYVENAFGGTEKPCEHECGNNAECDEVLDRGADKLAVTLWQREARNVNAAKEFADRAMRLLGS